MTEESREAYEHHLGRELPNAGAFGPALAGAAFPFFSRFQPANFPPGLVVVGLFFSFYRL